MRHITPGVKPPPSLGAQRRSCAEDDERVVKVSGSSPQPFGVPLHKSFVQLRNVCVGDTSGSRAEHLKHTRLDVSSPFKIFGCYLTADAPNLDGASSGACVSDTQYLRPMLPPVVLLSSTASLEFCGFPIAVALDLQ